jgi:hypothetical protein
MGQVKASVILSTYDRPRALTLSLSGYRRQSLRQFELIVADDGSDEETRGVIEGFRKRCEFMLIHVWQENRGFRRARIINQAVKASSAPLIIISDGDCIPHRDFVLHHVNAHLSNGFSVGGYLSLSYRYSISLTEERVEAGQVDRLINLPRAIAFKVAHWKNLYYIAVGYRRRPKAYGCNISIDRALFYAINGYDEDFDGFGKEDSDLRNRLVASGARARSLWDRAFVFHLDHAIDTKHAPKGLRDRVKERWYYYARPNIPVRCKNGLVKE